MGPQRDFLVAGAAREDDAFVDQPRTKSNSARLWLQQKQANAGDVFGLLHEHDGADFFAVHFGDPAALTLAIVVVDEIRDDLRANAFERRDPAVFLRVNFGMTRHDPTEIARYRLA